MEFPRIFNAWVAVRALDVVFWTCSLIFNCESSHIPRYWIDLAGLTTFCLPGMLVGTVIDGPLPACLPLVDLVKCMSLFLTWSSLRPLVVSHLWASLNVILTIFAVVVQSCADVAIEPSSTYRVSGTRLFLCGLRL